MIQLFKLQIGRKDPPTEAISNILKTIALKPDLGVDGSVESLG